MLVVLFSCAIHSFEPHAEDFIHILTFSVVICVGAYSAIFVFVYFLFFPFIEMVLSFILKFSTSAVL